MIGSRRIGCACCTAFLKAIEADVQVVWKDFFFKKGEFYRVGVKLVDILEENMEKLRSFLNNLTKVNTFSTKNVPPKLFIRPWNFNFRRFFILSSEASRGRLILPQEVISKNKDFAIEISHLKKVFGDLAAVDDVSFP
jgi:hypothetical protein